MSDNENHIEKYIPLIVFEAIAVKELVRDIISIKDSPHPPRRFSLIAETVSYGAAVIATDFLVKYLKRHPDQKKLADQNGLQTKEPLQPR